MRMINVSILMIILLTFASCKTPGTKVKNKNIKEKEVTIIGIAKNAKMGAVILTENQNVYYIDVINSWDDNIKGKELRVTGVIIVETFKAEDLKSEKGEWKTGMEGDKKTMLKPVWEMVEK